MPVPVGKLDPDVAAYLQELEDRLAVLETPQGYGPAFFTTSTSLSTANAAQNGARWGIATDLNTVVFSNGVHWYRADSGALIV